MRENVYASNIIFMNKPALGAPRHYHNTNHDNNRIIETDDVDHVQVKS